MDVTEEEFFNKELPAWFRTLLVDARSQNLAILVARSSSVPKAVSVTAVKCSGTNVVIRGARKSILLPEKSEVYWNNLLSIFALDLISLELPANRIYTFAPSGKSIGDFFNLNVLANFVCRQPVDFKVGEIFDGVDNFLPDLLRRMYLWDIKKMYSKWEPRAGDVFKIEKMYANLFAEVVRFNSRSLQVSAKRIREEVVKMHEQNPCGRVVADLLSARSSLLSSMG